MAQVIKKRYSIPNQLTECISLFAMEKDGTNSFAFYITKRNSIVAKSIFFVILTSYHFSLTLSIILSFTIFKEMWAISVLENERVWELFEQVRNLYIVCLIIDCPQLGHKVITLLIFGCFYWISARLYTLSIIITRNIQQYRIIY